MNVSTADVASYSFVRNLRLMASPWVGCFLVASARAKNFADGGFAEYCAYPAGKVFKIHNLSDIDATLLEPASCAAHGLEKIAPKLGSSVLMFGAGPTGLV